MKKVFLFIMMACLAVGFSACKKHKTLKQTEIVAERMISADREMMFMQYAPEYVWYETQVVYKHYLDTDSTSTEIENLENVFQFLKDGDPRVVISEYTTTTHDVAVKNSFWIEDFPIDSVKLTFNEAYEQLMKTNYPKPHSRNVVLRKPIGALPCNAQYIFGNIDDVLFVDAITGEVTNFNPAFSKE